MFPRPKPRESRIDITALIDVAFILIIFLVVTMTFLRERGLELSLPKAKGETAVAEKIPTVEVAPDGAMFFDGKPHYSRDTLISALKASGTLEEVYLKADRRARHGDVVRAMDAIKQAGTTRLTIAVEEEKSK